MHARRLRVVIAGAALLAAADLSAQDGAVGVRIDDYTLADPAVTGIESIAMRSVRFGFAQALPARLSLSIDGSWADLTVTGASGGEAAISGPTDTRVGLSWTVGGSWTVGTDLVLPTGVTELTSSEASAAAVAASQLLPLGVSAWGTGGGAGGEFGVAGTVGDLAVGAAVSYRAAREFEPLAGADFAYRPGNQVGVRVALDANVGSASTLALSGGWQSFSEDAQNSRNLFQPGSRIEAIASYSFPWAVYASGQLYAGVIHRSEGTALLQDPELLSVVTTPHQRLFVGGATVQFPVSSRITLLPSVDGRVFRTGDGNGQGWLAEFGAAADVRVHRARTGARWYLTPSAGWRTGSFDPTPESTTGISGWTAEIALRMEVGR